VTVYALGDRTPEIHPSAYIHPDAVVIGSVWIGPESSVWPGAVLRGDDGEIHIGARTSIQDGCVLHCAPHLPTVVGDECVIGHMVHLEGCVIEDGSLVGNGAVVLHQAVVRAGSLVGSNAVVTNGMEVPSGHMALGVPAKIRPGGDDLEAGIRMGMESYVARAQRYRQELRRID
jgi:carbonic anhydrase/acetyltransferase-like protein (isoleucine patch superfamily)